MRRIGEGSGNGETRREGARKREDTQSEEAAGLCVQMCRSGAGRRETRSMLT